MFCAKSMNEKPDSFTSKPRLPEMGLVFYLRDFGIKDLKKH